LFKINELEKEKKRNFEKTIKKPNHIEFLKQSLIDKSKM